MFDSGETNGRPINGQDNGTGSKKTGPKTRHKRRGAVIDPVDFYPVLGVYLHLLVANGKKHMSRPATVTRDLELVRNHLAAKGNLGFAPGPDLIVVDIDIKRGIDGNKSLADWLAGKGIDSLPPTVEVRTPSGGRHLYFSRDGDTRRLWSSRRECPGVDFLTGASNVVAFGSQIDGARYELVRGGLPAPCPPALLDALAFSSGEMDEIAKRPSLTLDELAEMLERLPNPDLGYEDYLRVGMATHFESCGSPEGFALWDEWAAKSEKYRSIDTSRRWGSFNADGSFQGVAAWGTLDRLLRELDVPVFDSIDDVPAPAPKARIAPSRAETAKPPGKVARMVYDFALAAAPRPSHEAAMTASVAVMSGLAERYYLVETNDSLNMYPLIILPTGGGKDVVRDMLVRLLYGSNVDWSGQIVDSVSSGQAIHEALNGNPNLVIWRDEIWEWLMATSERGGSHARSTAAMLMKVFTLGRSTLSACAMGQTKSNRPEVKNPYVTLAAASTPGRFAEALSAGHIADGLLNRLLVFWGPGQVQPIARTPRPTETPPELRNSIDAILMRSGLGNPGYREDTRISIDPVAQTLLFDFADETGILNHAGNPYGELWARASQTAQRLAGLQVIGDGYRVTPEIAEWAIEQVRFRVERLSVELGYRMASDKFEALCKRALFMIENASDYAGDAQFGELLKRGLMPAGKLLKHLGIRTRELDEVVGALEEQQAIEQVNVHTRKAERSGKRPTKCYRLVS